MNVIGGCHCGAITFEAKIDTSKVLICHCHDCQKISGTSFRTVAMAEVGHFNITKGKAKEYVKTAESGNRRAQGFCQDCGSSLYACNEAMKNRAYGIRVGAIEQKVALKPMAQIWCNSAVPWLMKINQIPQFETAVVAPKL
jgi:hypothetical protein